MNDLARSLRGGTTRIKDAVPHGVSSQDTAASATATRFASGEDAGGDEYAVSRETHIAAFPTVPRLFGPLQKGRVAAALAAGNRFSNRGLLRKTTTSQRLAATPSAGVLMGGRPKRQIVRPPAGPSYSGFRILY